MGGEGGFSQRMQEAIFSNEIKIFLDLKKKKKRLFAEVSFGDWCLQYKSFFQWMLEQRDVVDRKCNRDKNDFTVFTCPARGFRYSEFVFLPAFI